MDRTPYFDQLRLWDVARIDAEDARAYLEERARVESPRYPAYREHVGDLMLRLYDHTASARLLHTGKHCRSFGIEFGGVVLGPMGIDRAFSTIISPAVRRPHSIRHCL
jgi:hypothetical protein